MAALLNRRYIVAPALGAAGVRRGSRRRRGGVGACDGGTGDGQGRRTGPDGDDDDPAHPQV